MTTEAGLPSCRVQPTTSGVWHHGSSPADTMLHTIGQAADRGWDVRDLSSGRLVPDSGLPDHEVGLRRQAASALAWLNEHVAPEKMRFRWADCVLVEETGSGSIDLVLG